MITIHHLEFTEALVAKITETIAQQLRISRRQLSRHICTWMIWRSPNGKPREVTCRKALLELHRRKLIELPDCQEYAFHTRQARPAELPALFSLDCSLAELGPVQLVPIRSATSKNSRIWNALFDAFHYLGSGPLCGAQLRYLLFSERFGYLGGLSFSASAWRVRCRDEFIFLLLAFGCASTQPKIPMDMASATPGDQVNFRGKPTRLLGSPISLGKPLPSVELVDAMTMNGVDLSKERGSVLLLSIVPSIDTRVCEEQTHYLGEKGDKLPRAVKRITISRDTPFAQKRFSKEAKLTNIQYLSDYKQGDFGRSMGLLVDGSMLLARSILLVDQQGIVRYIQVVPDMSHLPDMEKAFEKAVSLSGEK